MSSSLVSIDCSPVVPVAIPRRQTSTRVALVCMPWGSVIKTSMAMGILKTCVSNAGYAVDSHFLNALFAGRIGLQNYEQISDCAKVITEWCFAHWLFGRNGTNELANSWEDLLADKDASGSLDDLKAVFDDDGKLFRKLAEEDVPAFIAECLNQADWSQYMCVGFTTTFAQSTAALLLAKRIKELNPEVSIVFGGANVDGEMGVEFMRAFPWIDYVVHGEAEVSFPMLLDNMASGALSKVPGVSSRMNGNVVPGDHTAVPITDLNSSPLPDYSDYYNALNQHGLRKHFEPKLFFESSRGCWWGAKHHCTFCGLNGSTMSYRRKDPARVCDEILTLSTRYRCLTLAATDNILSMDYFRSLLPELKSHDLDLEMFYEVKANLTREQIQERCGTRAFVASSPESRVSAPVCWH